MSNRDAKRLEGVHPKVAAAYIKVNIAMAAIGFPIFVVEGVRTTERQQTIWAQGRTTAGRIVTKADGVNVRSNHQVHADNMGHAIDFAFIDDPRTPQDETFDSTMPWDLVGQMAERLGLRWGGRRASWDLGHIELP